jgi:hypothetical protein
VHTPVYEAPTQGVAEHTGPSAASPESVQSVSVLQAIVSMAAEGPPHPVYTPPGAQSPLGGWHWLDDEHVEPPSAETPFVPTGSV